MESKRKGCKAVSVLSGMLHLGGVQMETGVNAPKMRWALSCVRCIDELAELVVLCAVMALNHTAAVAHTRGLTWKEDKHDYTGARPEGMRVSVESWGSEHTTQR
jgi:hypothetical protein